VATTGGFFGIVNRQTRGRHGAMVFGGVPEDRIEYNKVESRSGVRGTVVKVGDDGPRPVLISFLRKVRLDAWADCGHNRTFPCFVIIPRVV